MNKHNKTKLTDHSSAERRLVCLWTLLSIHNIRFVCFICPFCISFSFDLLTKTTDFAFGVIRSKWNSKNCIVPVITCIVLHAMETEKIMLNIIDFTSQAFKNMQLKNKLRPTYQTGFKLFWLLRFFSSSFLSAQFAWSIQSCEILISQFRDV